MVSTSGNKHLARVEPVSLMMQLCSDFCQYTKHRGDSAFRKRSNHPGVIARCGEIGRQLYMDVHDRVFLFIRMLKSPSQKHKSCQQVFFFWSRAQEVCQIGPPKGRCWSQEPSFRTYDNCIHVPLHLLQKDRFHCRFVTLQKCTRRRRRQLRSQRAQSLLATF